MGNQIRGREPLDQTRGLGPHDHELSGRRIAFLAADGVEAVELERPRQRLEGVGATVELLSLEAGDVRGVNGMEPGATFRADRAVRDADPEDYAGLVIPGGLKSPDLLRQHRPAVDFVRRMARLQRPVAAVCHGPWLLIEAGLLHGRVITSYPSLQTDVRNAGGAWVDEEVHVDGCLITSRTPEDLDAFCDRLIEAFSKGTPLGVTSPPKDKVLDEADVDEASESSFPASDPPPLPTKA